MMRRRKSIHKGFVYENSRYYHKPISGAKAPLCGAYGLLVFNYDPYIYPGEIT